MVVASIGLAVQGGDDDDVERGRRIGCNAS